MKFSPFWMGYVFLDPLSLFPSRSLRCVYETVVWGWKNQWKKCFFRWLCYIRKNSLPKERQVLAKKFFLIRTFSLSLFLILSLLTHPFLSSHSFILFVEAPKKSPNIRPHLRERRRKIVERKTKEKLFAHRHLKRKKKFVPKKWTRQVNEWVSESLLRGFHVSKWNWQIIRLTTFRFSLELAIHRWEFLFLPINLPVAKFLFLFFFRSTILWRWWSPRHRPCCCFFILESLFFLYKRSIPGLSIAEQSSWNAFHLIGKREKSFCWAFHKFLVFLLCADDSWFFPQGYFAALAKITFVANSRTRHSLNPHLICPRVN